MSAYLILSSLLLENKGDFKTIFHLSEKQREKGREEIEIDIGQREREREKAHVCLLICWFMTQVHAMGRVGQVEDQS